MRGQKPKIQTQTDSCCGGTITVRMSKARHLRLAEFARDTLGVSINEFVLQAIAKEIVRRSGDDGDWSTEYSGYAGLVKQVEICLRWFQVDGQPVDGPRFREEFDKLRLLVGLPASRQPASKEGAA